MGRAMLIICSGLIIALGITIIGTNNQARLLTRFNAGYANTLKAKNSAHLAVQMAINNINENPLWDDNHNSEITAWEDTLNGVLTSVWIESLSDTVNAGIKEETFRIHAGGSLEDQQINIISVYQKSELHGVPEFKSVISFSSSNFTFLMADSATLNGVDPVGSCDDMPGIITTSEADSSNIASNSSSGQIQGTPAIKVDPDAASYTSFSELVEYLDGMTNVTHLPGNYTGSLGDSTSPGVYFVDSPVDIKSDISEGYGILVVREDGRLYYKGNTDIADKLTFNGLVIFEDALDFKADNTPSISGSVAIGNTGSSPTLDVVLDGSIKISYDCNAPKYARKASALIFEQDGFRRIVTFE